MSEAENDSAAHSVTDSVAEQCRVEARLESDDTWLWCGNVTHVDAAADCARSKGILEGYVMTRDMSSPHVEFRHRVTRVVLYSVIPLRNDHLMNEPEPLAAKDRE